MIKFIAISSVIITTLLLVLSWCRAAARADEMMDEIYIWEKEGL